MHLALLGAYHSANCPKAEQRSVGPAVQRSKSLLFARVVIVNKFDDNARQYVIKC